MRIRVYVLFVGEGGEHRWFDTNRCKRVSDELTILCPVTKVGLRYCPGSLLIGPGRRRCILSCAIMRRTDDYPPQQARRSFAVCTFL